jgi:hypothetical protein
MQLNLTSFKKEITTENRIEDTIASRLVFNGLENVSNLQEILSDILLNYELEALVDQPTRKEFLISFKTMQQHNKRHQ